MVKQKYIRFMQKLELKLMLMEFEEKNEFSSKKVNFKSKN